MPGQDRLTRRGLLRSAAAAAVPLFLPSCSRASDAPRPAPSERIALGMIGIGKQGGGHLGGMLGHPRVQVVAVCDVSAEHRQSAQARAEQHYEGVAACGDFRELLARDDVEAVLIATPDHWHGIMAVAAARAGKDIYCEKPLSLTISQARAMSQAVDRYGRVFQTGSQQRSAGNFRRGCELVRSGYIGQVREVFVNVGGPSRPCPLPPAPAPEGLDYDFWLGPAPYAPYHPERVAGTYGGVTGWRAWFDYSGGMMTDWGAHHFDIAQWGLGMDHTGPAEIAPPDGGEFTRLTYRYANGVTMYRGTGPFRGDIQFIGDKGKVGLGRGAFFTEPENLKTAPVRPDDVRLYESASHRDNWLTCVRSRGRCICDVETGARSVTVCHLGNIALALGRPLRWDPEAERFPGDDQANRMIDRAMRSPWTL